MLRQIVPPIVWTIAHRVRRQVDGKQVFDSYDEALATAETAGYDSEEIARGTVEEVAGEAERIGRQFPLTDSRTLRQLAAIASQRAGRARNSRAGFPA
jgi:hypothetical protein